MKVFEGIEILAQGEVQKQPGNLDMFLILGIFVVIMWVVMIRPQQKRQKEMQRKIDALQKNDKIVTIGGIHGVINHVGKQTLSLRVAEGVFMTFDKKSVATVLNEPSANKGEEKANQKDKKD